MKIYIAGSVIYNHYEKCTTVINKKQIPARAVLNLAMIRSRCMRSAFLQVRYKSNATRGPSQFKLDVDIPQKMAGVLVDSSMDNTRVITREEAFIKYKNEGNVREFEGNHADASLVTRFDSKTLDGKMSLSGTLKLNPTVAEGINEYILKQHSPNHLRQSAANYYAELQTSKIHRPCRTPMEVDSHIASIFLQNYGSLYQSLFELQKRCGADKFNPQKVLDVGYGPSTGIVALNDLMGPGYRPVLKDSVILGSVEMQKRAKVILSRQYNEIPLDDIAKITKTNASAAEETQQHTQEEEKKDDIEEKDKLFGDIDTKKINIITNLKKRVPGKPKKYDLIMIQHQLLKDEHEFPLQVELNLEHYIELLEPNGHLVIVERGNPMGFETVARARELVLRPENHEHEDVKTGKVPRLWKENKQKRQDSDNPDFDLPIENRTFAKEDVYLKVVAPCAHHRKCPLQVGKPLYYEFKSLGNLKFCNNQKKIQRPKFSIELKRGKILGSKWKETEQGFEVESKSVSGSGRQNATDYEILNYSYLILERTPDADLSSTSTGGLADVSPRVVDQPLKKKGHVVLTVCGSEGEISKWTVPKSFDKQLYHDARKSNKNDIWMHGAKTKIKSRSLQDNEAKFEKFVKFEKNLYKKRLQKIKNEEFKLNEDLETLKEGGDSKDKVGVLESSHSDDKAALNKEIELLAKLHGHNFSMSEKGKKILKNKKKEEYKKYFDENK